MKSRNKGKKVVIVIMFLLLILAIVLGGLYFYLTTDILKTPEQLFKKYMLSNFQELINIELKPFDEIVKRSENEVTEYDLNLGINVPESEFGIEEMKFDAKLALKTDTPNKNEELEILINKDEEEFFKGYMALTNETFGIKISDLYDKFIAIENRDFKKMAKTFNIPDESIENIPDKMPPALTKEEEEKIKLLMVKYITKFFDQIEENSYIAEKNININVNSTDLVTNKYTAEVGTQKLYTILTNMISELFEDPEFLELTNARITSDQMNDIKEAYKEFLNENYLENIEDQIIRISLYTANGRTVKTEIKTIRGEEFSFSLIKNENEASITSSIIIPKSDYNEIGTTINYTIKNVYTADSGELSIESTVSYDKNDIESLQAEYDAENEEYSDIFQIDYTEMYADEKTKYIITTKKSNEDTYVGNIKFEGESLDELKDILTISFKCQFGKASITTISDKNAVIINDYTMQDYEKLGTEIMTNLMNCATSKPNSLIATIFTSYFEEDEEDYDYDYNYDYDYDYNYDNNYDDYDYDYNYDNGDFSYDYDEYFSPESLKEDFDMEVTYALEVCLNLYKNEILYNPDANLGDFLNIDKVQEYCRTDHSLELLDSTTIRCVINKDGIEYVLYALMNIDGETLSVTDVEVLLEEEYLNR